MTARKYPMTFEKMTNAIGMSTTVATMPEYVASCTYGRQKFSEMDEYIMAAHRVVGRNSPPEKLVRSRE